MELALLIGINEYPHLPYHAQLHGCVNDVDIMASALKDRFGFDDANTTVLKNEKATRDSIVAELKRILAICSANDVVVFYFSGHGISVKNYDINKGGFEEAIVTFDSGGPLEDRYIRDSDIRDWIALLVKKTSNIHLFFDCCHSGSMTRDLEEIGGARKTRGVSIDETKEISLAPGKKHRQPHTGLFSSFFKDSPGPNLLSLSDSYSLLTACKKEEKAREFLLSKDGKFYGAFTHFLVKRFGRVLKSTTYQDIFEQLRIDLLSHSFPQSPQIQGAGSRRLFSNTEVETMKYLSIKERVQDRAVLAGGAVHDLTVDSEWAVYPAGIKQSGLRSMIGTVKITNVAVTETEAAIITEKRKGLILPGCRAVETVHYHEDRKKIVRLGAVAGELSPIRKLIEKNIKRSSWIRLAGQGEAADLLVILSPLETAGNGKAEFQVEVFQPDGTLTIAKVLDSGNVAAVTEDLEKLSRYAAILALENPSSKLKESIEFNLFQKINGKWSKAKPAYNDQPVFREDEQIAFEVVNNSMNPIYFSVLDMGLSKRISLFFPKNAESERLGAETRQDISAKVGVHAVGLETRGAVTLYIPEAIFLNEYPDIKEKGGIETFKLIVTTEQSDFRFVAQTGVKTRGASQLSIEELLYKYSSDSVTREVREVVRQDDWLTINRMFYLFKR